MSGPAALAPRRKGRRDKTGEATSAVMAPWWPNRPREDPWRLFLNFSWIGFAGGLLLALIGAWFDAALVFGFGFLFALLAAWRLRLASPGSPRA